MRPTPRLLGALGLGAAVLFVGVSSGVAWLFLVGYGIWAVALAALPYACWSDRQVRGAVRAGEAHGPSGTLPTLPPRLLAAAPAPGPLFETGWLTVELELGTARHACGPARLGGVVGGQEVSLGAGVVAARGVRTSVRLGPVRRGPVAAEAIVLETGDPLGLFRRRRRLADSELAVAHPLFATLADPAGGVEPAGETPAGRAASGLEFAGVREHRPGDSARRIHWRSSARHGRLVVREHEPPDVPRVAVVVDPAPPGPEAADQVARIAASEVWDCVRRGGRAEVTAPGLRGAGPAGAHGLWTLLDWLARYPELPAGEELPAAAPTVVAVVCSEAALPRSRTARTWLVAEGGAVPGAAARVVGTAWPLD